jgi:hypothetical protein
VDRYQCEYRGRRKGKGFNVDIKYAVYEYECLGTDSDKVSPQLARNSLRNGDRFEACDDQSQSLQLRHWQLELRFGANCPFVQLVLSS